MNEELVEIIIPIGICVVLPIIVMWIITRAKINKDNKNAEVIIKAIESNNDVDVDKLVEALGSNNGKDTPVQTLQKRLLRGCSLTFVGIALAIYTFYGAYYNYSRDQVSTTALLSLIALAMGIAYLVVYFVTRKSVSKGEK